MIRYIQVLWNHHHVLRRCALVHIISTAVVPRLATACQTVLFFLIGLGHKRPVSCQIIDLIIVIILVIEGHIAAALPASHLLTLLNHESVIPEIIRLVFSALTRSNGCPVLTRCELMRSQRRISLQVFGPAMLT